MFKSALYFLVVLALLVACTQPAPEVEIQEKLIPAVSSLVSIIPEPAGENCPAAGQRIDSGLDENANLVLDDDEVSSTSYVCNASAGDAGNGKTGLVNVSIEPAGPNCTAGGQRIDTGHDENGNGILDAGEITASAYVCNGTNGAPGKDGLNGNDGSTSLVVVTTEGPGPNCLAGGHKIEVGLDEDKNGKLEGNEVKTTSYACNGTDGKDGAPSSDGGNGLTSLVVVTVEPQGENCPAGGQKIETGIDANGDKELGAGEVETTAFVCNGVEGKEGAPGAPGKDGEAGAVRLVNVEPEAPNANCPAGGNKIETGIDGDKDGKLGALEIDWTFYVCHGSDGVPGSDGAPGKDGANGEHGLTSLVNVKPEAAGPNCPNGGSRIEVGFDENEDGKLEGDEISSFSYVCNGADGSPGSNGSNGANSLVKVAPEGEGSNCSAGGHRVEVGPDTNGNQQLDAEEVKNTYYVCHGSKGEAGDDGDEGLVSLVSVSAEPKGENCANGGQKIEVGLDINRDGDLDSDEVESTTYACNGEDGIPGNDGDDGLSTLVKVTLEPAGGNCAADGQKIEVGIDDNRDGTLSAGEVDSTHYVCDGSDGADGHSAISSIRAATVEECPAGGQVLVFGIDDGAGDGIANDGILHDDEVDGTVAMCHAQTEAAMIPMRSGGPATPKNILELNGEAYFTATLDGYGAELVRSRGTAASTSLVSDIYPGIAGSNPSQLTMVGNTLYFAANSNSHGTELWKSDGTNEGTQLVKDITPGFSSSNLGHLTAVGSRLFFVAGATDARSLWRSEGTEETTVMVKQIRTGWETNPHLLTAVGNTLFFVADDGTNGFELWKSDGTEAGTVMVKNIMDPLNTQSYFYRSSSPDWLVAYGGYLFFSASDDTDIELWRSDGTDLGTVKLDLAPGNLYGEPSRLTVAGETLYFVASNGVDGKELWKLDEPTGTPEMVKNIGPGSSDPRHLTAVGNLLYFTANDGTHGYELWRSDGTEAGTYMLKDINPTGHGLKSSETYPQIVGVGSTVYFVADDGVRGTELWKTDGTSAGTVLVQEITPGSSGTNFFSMKNIAGKLFFTEGVNSESTELWVLNPSMYFAD